MKKTLRPGIAATALLMFAVAFAGPARAQCDAQDDVPVAVEIQKEPVEIVFDTSLEDLDQLARAAHKEAHMPLLAAYDSDARFEVDLETQVRPSVPSGFCAGAKSALVRIVLGKRTIHVARELRDLACLRKAATEHAEAHARNQEQAWAGVESLISANVKKRLREASTISGGSAVDAKRQLTRAITEQVRADLANADSAKYEASRAVDSPESLARLRAACPDERGDLFGIRT